MPFVTRYPPAPLRDYPIQYTLPYRQFRGIVRRFYPFFDKSEIFFFPFSHPLRYQPRLVLFGHRSRCPLHYQLDLTVPHGVVLLARFPLAS
jgi:hypothetical protein